MEEQVSLIINISYGSDSVKQKSFSDISPTATDKQIYDFAVAVVGLTTGEFRSAYKVTRKELGANSSGT